MKRIIIIAIMFFFTNISIAKNIAIVNGKTITQENLDQFVNLLVNQGAKDSPELREQIKQELINRQVLLQAAEKSNIENKPDVQTELRLAKESIIVRYFLTEYLKKNNISEKEIEEQYHKLKKEQSNKKEFKVSHILFDNEKDANNIIDDLNKNKIKFVEAAKKYSKDEGSKINGGELGWSSSENYVQEFANALKSLQQHEFTKKPVKTSYGWHVIKLDDVRDIDFPEIDQVKPQIEEMLKQKALSSLQQELKSKSIIQ